MRQFLTGFAFAVALFAAPAANSSTGNGVIAFVRDGDVWTIDPESGIQTNLTAGEPAPTFRGGPLSWSPDGSRLLYSANIPGSPQGHAVAMSMSADGSSKHPLVDDPTRNWWPECWLGPDLIALRGAALDGSSADFYAVRLDGTGLRPLTSDGSAKFGFGFSVTGMQAQVVITHPEELCSSAAGLLFFPSSLRGPNSLAADATLRKLPLPFGSVSPSPDGSRLAWIGNNGLFVTDIDGTNPTKLADAYAPSWLKLGPAQWSPDGSEIAFPSARPLCCSDEQPSHESSLHVVSASGGGERALTPEAGERVAPLAWSPDGTKILFSSDRGGSAYGAPKVFVMNADGSCQKRLFTAALPYGVSQGAVWQPAPGKEPDAPTRCADIGIKGNVFMQPVGSAGTTPYAVEVTNGGNLSAHEVRLSFSDFAWVRLRSLEAVGRSCEAMGCRLGTMGPGERIVVTANLAGTNSGFPTSAAAHFTVEVTSAEPPTDGTDDRMIVHTRAYGCGLVGTDRSDRFVGTAASDSFCGASGADAIFGRKGDDQLAAGPGADFIDGGPGRDLIYGGGGDDVIQARDGRKDAIDCGGGHDRAVVDRNDSVTGCENVLRGRG